MAGGQHIFAVAEVLTAANTNAYLMDQSIMRVTSGTRPTAMAQGGALLNGTTIYQTDTKTYAAYGTSWCETSEYSANQAGAGDTTASATYADPTNPGPAVTVTTGTKVLVTLTMTCSNSGANANYMSFAVSGATTLAAADTNAVLHNQGTAGATVSTTFLVTGLTAGSNVFTAKYRTAAGTMTLTNGIGVRNISVVAIPT